MNVMYFAVACVLLAGVAYVESRRNSDSFRLEVFAIFGLVAGITLVLFGSRIPISVCIVLATVTICATTDVSSGYIYNVTTYPSFVAIVAASLRAGNLGSALAWALGTFLAGLIFHGAMRGRGLGLGDVKLFTVIAAALGSTVAEVVAGSFVFGACAVGVALIRGRLSFGQTTAFAPYIAFATIAAVPVQGLFQ